MSDDQYKQHHESIDAKSYRKNSFVKFVVKNPATLSAIVVVLFGGLVAARLFSANAAEIPPPLTEGIPEVVSNQVMVKLKSETHKHIKDKPSANDTGDAELDKVTKANGVKRVDRVVPKKRDANKETDVDRWVLVTFDPPANGKASIKVPTVDASQNAGDNAQKNKKKSSDRNDGVAYNQIVDHIANFKASPAVENAEPNYLMKPTVAPNDPFYSSSSIWTTYPDLWGMRKITPEAAWDQTTGSTSIVVADIDTGVDRNHPDIRDNMWVNTREIQNNGVDDDANGYVDDYYGWDFFNNDNDPIDDMGHGTHTVGTIAATGNNGLGVVGVNWKAKVMALKFLPASGGGPTSGAVAAMEYAGKMGAKVTSNSWGCACFDQALDDELNAQHARGIVTVVAAGNSKADAYTHSPAGSAAAITVSATDKDDALASFSNFGNKIDVGAPGVFILSAKAAGGTMCSATVTIGTNYCYVSGTSMATPHVAGLATLLLSKYPNLSSEQVRQIIRQGATDLSPAGFDTSFGYGRINVSATMTRAASPVITPYISSPVNSAAVTTSTMTVTGSASGAGFASYKIDTKSDSTEVWKQQATSTTPVADGTLASYSTAKMDDGINIIRLTVTDTSGKTYEFTVGNILIKNLDVNLTSPVGLVNNTTQQVKDITGTAMALNGAVLTGYTLEYGVGTAPTSWSTAGITKTSSGNVANAKLGTWDTTGLAANSAYSLRLTATTSVNTTSVAQAYITISPDSINGWSKIYEPARPNDMSAFAFGQQMAADLLGDGNKEVIYVSDSYVHAISKSGNELAGFPINITMDGAESAFYRYNQLGGNVATVGDINNDGKSEIIVETVSLQGTDTHKFHLRAYGGDGRVLSTWSVPSAWDSTTPLVMDVNKDGTNEVVWLDRWVDATYKQNFKLHAFNGSGVDVAGYPLNYQDLTNKLHGFTYHLSAADVDKDGHNEFVITVGTSIFAFNDRLQLLNGWPHTDVGSAGSGSAEYGDRTASFGDTNNDGKLEIWTTSSNTTNPDGYVLYGYNIDGSSITGWPRLITSFSDQSGPVILANVDNDPEDEVIVNPGQGSILAYNSDGTRSANIASYGYPFAVSDVTNDSKGEAIVAMRGSLLGSPFQSGIITYAISAQQSQMIKPFCPGDIYGWCVNNAPYYSSPIVADLDNNGRPEIVSAVTQYSECTICKAYVLAGVGSSPAIKGVVGFQALELPTSKTTPGYWNMTGHDASNSGNSKGPFTAGSTTPPPPINRPPVVSIGATPPSGSAPLTVNLSATATDPDGTIAKVDFYQDSTLLSSDTTAPYTASKTGLAAGSYTFKAIATDNNGASTTATTPVTVSPVAAQPPTVSLTAPTNGATVSGVVSLTANAADPSGVVSSVDFKLDGTTINHDTTSPYAFSWNSVATSNGSHTITAMATNPSNLTANSTVTVTVSNDRSAPTNPGGFTLAAPNATTVNLSWTASTDNVGVTGYYIYRGGVAIKSVTGTSTQDTGLVGGATYTYGVAAFDAAGNISGIVSKAITTPPAPDTDKPTPATSVKATAVSQTQINLTWAPATDTGGSGLKEYDIYRDNLKITTIQAFTAGGTPVAVTSYGDGGLVSSTTHSYYLIARDGALNVSPQSNIATATTQSPPSTGLVAPTNLTISADNVLSVWWVLNLKWAVPADLTMVTGYKAEVFDGTSLQQPALIATGAKTNNVNIPIDVQNIVQSTNSSKTYNIKLYSTGAGGAQSPPALPFSTTVTCNSFLIFSNCTVK